MPNRPSPHVQPRASLGLLILASVAMLGCPPPSTEGDGDETGGECLIAGSLVISEITANVAGADAGLEWFEIYNASGETIDLEGLYLNYEKVDGSGSKAHPIARSLEIPAGGYVVVGSMTDENAQGAAHVDYGYGEDLGELGNTSGYLAIGCESGEIIDEVYYADASEDASRAFDGGFAAPDAVANDNLDNWCDSTTELTAGFAATPGATNDPCGGASTCGDGVDVVLPELGELIITEVHPAPDAPADNADGEWFEVHSLADHDVHLNGVWIGKSIDDTAEHRIAAIDCLALAPGEYAVLAASDDPTANAMIPPESILYVSPVGLTNADSSVWLGLDEDGEALIDLVTWASTKNGEARQLDPGAFDPAANDDLASWCPATTPYGAGDLGTPGAANLDCPLPQPPSGQCYEDGELRDVVPPQMGEIAIREVMPDPANASDTTGEWFEIRADATFDLNGLELGKNGVVEHTVTVPECLTLNATDYFVFARSDVDNCGLAYDYSYDDDLSLNNSDGNVQIGHAGVVLDEYSWAGSDSGVAMQYDPVAMMWCDATEAYGDCVDPGNLGTPGAQNSACGGSMGTTCIDPQVMMPRNINTPVPGGLILSEVMPNPSTGEPAGEWLELYATANLDLNGLELYDTGALRHTVTAEECVEIQAGSYVVLARSDVLMDNCLLPSVDWVYDGLSMTNGGDTVEIGYGGMIFDSYTWPGSTDGTAWAYDQAGMQWCEAVDSFGCGDLATPGAANPACGGGMMMGMCLDGMMMRPIVTPNPGDLVISEFMANPDAVTDANGEWFEVHALAAVDLNGVEFGRLFMDGTLATVTSNDCIALAPGDAALFARNVDNLTNGGLPAVDVQFSFGLTNSNSALHIASGGVLLDEITWTSVATGASTSLDPGSLDPNVNDTADDALPWCYASTPYGDGDDGTPGADNQQCP